MVQRQKTTEIGLFLIGVAITALGLIMAQFWDALLMNRFYKVIFFFSFLLVANRQEVVWLLELIVV